MRNFIHILSLYIRIFLILFFCGCESDQKPKMVNIYSHSLSMFSKGSGTPAIVIDVGFAESYNNWMQIIDSLSEYSRVIAYDRAGYGQSEPGPFPRDCQQEVLELNTMLERANVKQPYIIIGHSLGALNAQYFAYMFSTATAGLVLLDPPPFGWISGRADFPDLDSMAREQTESFYSMAEMARASVNPEDELFAEYFETLASEHSSMFNSSAELIGSIGSFSDLPLTVIAGGRANPRFGKSAERFQRFWINESRAVASKSSRGKFVLIEESTHHIHKDFPQQVISEIKKMLTDIRKNRFETDNIKKEFERLKRLDVKFTMEAIKMRPVTLAIFDDTCGNLIQIVEKQDNS